MNRRFPHLAQRVFNVPLAIHPAKAEIIMAALADRLGVAALFGRTPGAYYSAEDEAGPERGYEVVSGVAIIPIEGTLVMKLGTCHPVSGMTGYDGITANLRAAVNDRSVRAICLDIDSPGGECAGLFDLVDAIVEARASKPIHAILTECAYSAAYAIASAADHISVPRTGGAGSIGVICMHIDWSKAISESGANVTLVRFGDRKFEGNEFEPLSKQALAALQDNVNAMGQLFATTVALNRGMTVKAVLDTEAACFMAADALEAGLVDAIQSPEAAFETLLNQLD